jgi:hypothetical protein
VAAFVTSLLVVFGGIGICLFVGHRRPVGTPVTWGEAFVGATFVFALMTVAYGIVPHQWLTYADNELLWRPDRVLLGLSSAGIKMGNAGKTISGSGRIIVSYQALRDVIAAVLYGIFLTLHVVLWGVWQKRGRSKSALEPTSRFGRPVIRKA